MKNGNVSLTEHEGWWRLEVSNEDGGLMIPLSQEEIDSLRALLQLKI